MAKVNNIYQDKKTKKWFYRAYLGIDESGKKIQKTRRGFLTQKEAKIAYDRFTATHEFNKPIISQISIANRMTFKEFYQIRFVKWYERQVKRQTYENAHFIFEKKLQYFYSLKIAEITSQDIEDWMFELSQTATRNARKKGEMANLSKSYINRIRGHMKIVMDRAVKEGLIQKNPVNDVSVLSVSNHKVDFWELDEFKKVMEHFPDNTIQNKHRKLIFEILFYTGLRIGELQALPWSNVNFSKNQITVDKTLVYQDKEHWYLSTPKTNKAYRTIGIGKNLSKKLSEWKKLQSMIGDFKYVTQIDGTFTPSYSFSSWLKAAAKKAGVKQIKLHSLRHSHVALLIEKNIQPLMIQERMGHSTIQITLGTYGHLYAKSDQQVVEVLDDLVD